MPESDAAHPDGIGVPVRSQPPLAAETGGPRPEGSGPSATALVRRLAAGDTAAMDAFYDVTSAGAYGLACRLLGDPRLAQATLHDVYVDAWCRVCKACPAAGMEVHWILSLVLEHCSGTVNAG